ncbi:hypothetical protein MRX96_035445 [Rhipicephalus microplus]
MNGLGAKQKVKHLRGGRQLLRLKMKLPSFLQSTDLKILAKVGARALCPLFNDSSKARAVARVSQKPRTAEIENRYGVFFPVMRQRAVLVQSRPLLECSPLKLSEGGPKRCFRTAARINWSTTERKDSAKKTRIRKTVVSKAGIEFGRGGVREKSSRCVVIHVAVIVLWLAGKEDDAEREERCTRNRRS